MCSGCPFNYCSEESNQFQNLGCLPSPYDILMEMKEANKNWACHDNPKKVCKGLVNFVDEMNKPINMHIIKDRERNGHIPIKIDFEKELLTQEGVHY